MYQWPHFDAVFFGLVMKHKLPEWILTKYITLRYEIWTATESEMSEGDSPADDLSTEAADYRTKVTFIHGEKTYQSAFAR